MDKYIRITKRKAADSGIDLLPTLPSLNEAQLHQINTELVNSTVKRGKYAKLNTAQKLEVGRYGLQHGTTSALRKFGDKYDLKESSVNHYKKFAKKYKDTPEHVPITDSPKGRPKIMPEGVRQKIQETIVDLRDVGGIVNSTTTIAIMTGLLKITHPHLLRENGGPLCMNKMYAWRFLNEMGWTYRAINGDKGALPPDWESKKLKWVNEVTELVKQHNVIDDLLINLDQTGIKLIPSSSYTYAVKGTSDVSATGANDKREITAVVAGSKSGVFLPAQLIYTGKTDRCLPKNKEDIPESFHLTKSDSHWATEATMLEYADHILKPYLETVRSKLTADQSKKAIVLLDVYKVHQCESVIDRIKSLNCEVKFVPGSMTSKCQPMDLSVNKSLKSRLKDEYNVWYSEEVKKAFENSVDKSAIAKSINLAMSRIKPLATGWFVTAWSQVTSEVVKNGFKEAGL